MAAALRSAGPGTPPTRMRRLPGNTGGFGEPTCVACHFEGLTAGFRRQGRDRGPAFEVCGWCPVRAGHRAHAVRHGAGGLQLGALRGRIRAHSRPAFSVRSPKTSRSPSGRRPIHPPDADRKPVAAAGSPRWRVEWTAPNPGASPVGLPHGRNAANGDESALGDHVLLVPGDRRPADSAATMTSQTGPRRELARLASAPGGLPRRPDPRPHRRPRGPRSSRGRYCRPRPPRSARGPDGVSARSPCARSDPRTPGKASIARRSSPARHSSAATTGARGTQKDRGSTDRRPDTRRI